MGPLPFFHISVGKGILALSVPLRLGGKSSSSARFCYDTPAMTLREAVDKYLSVAGSYGQPVALSSLGLSRQEIETTFGQLDEDYHISRFIRFQCAAGANFSINGFPQTHVSIDPGIQTAL